MTVRFQEYPEWDADEDKYLDKVPARYKELVNKPQSERLGNDLGWWD